MFGGVNYLPHHDLLFDKYVPGSDGRSLTTKRIREIASDNKGNYGLELKTMELIYWILLLDR